MWEMWYEIWPQFKKRYVSVSSSHDQRLANFHGTTGISNDDGRVGNAIVGGIGVHLLMLIGWQTRENVTLQLPAFNVPVTTKQRDVMMCQQNFS